MPKSMEPVASPRHIPQLDGLRGVAIGLVLIGHQTESSLKWLAQLGVILFFVLSGFLITTLIVAEKQNSGSVHLIHFYWRRSLRLVPALAIFMAAIYFLARKGWLPHIPRYEFIACLLYMRNFVGKSNSVAHLWSLSLEEQFYIAWPPLVKLLNSTRLLVISACITIVLSLWRGVAMSLHLFDYNMGIYYLRPYFRFDSILIGCCFALCLTHKPGLMNKMGVMIRSVPVGVIWLLVIIWTLFGESVSPPVYVTIQMIGATWILFRAITDREFYLLTRWPLLFLGKISYSLYLWQQIFLFVKYPALQSLQVFPINVIAPIVIATCSHFLIERPFLRLKNSWRPKGWRDRYEVGSPKAECRGAAAQPNGM